MKEIDITQKTKKFDKDKKIIYSTESFWTISSTNSL